MENGESDRSIQRVEIGQTEREGEEEGGGVLSLVVN